MVNKLTFHVQIHKKGNLLEKRNVNHVNLFTGFLDLSLKPYVLYQFQLEWIPAEQEPIEACLHFRYSLECEQLSKLYQRYSSDPSSCCLLMRCIGHRKRKSARLVMNTISGHLIGGSTFLAYCSSCCC